MFEELVSCFITVYKSIVEGEKECSEKLHEDGVKEKNPCAGPHVAQCIPSISLRISVILMEIDLSH